VRPSISGTLLAGIFSRISKLEFDADPHVRFTGIVGLNPAWGVDVCLLCVVRSGWSPVQESYREWCVSLIVKPR